MECVPMRLDAEARRPALQRATDGPPLAVPPPVPPALLPHLRLPPQHWLYAEPGHHRDPHLP
eukprot:scaffold13546_cov181-Cylindrotheca_fusiformis.AAC.1